MLCWVYFWRLSDQHDERLPDGESSHTSKENSCNTSNMGRRKACASRNRVREVAFCFAREPCNTSDERVSWRPAML